MIPPLTLLRCLENPFADMSLQRPHYSWEVTRRFNYAERLVRDIARGVEHVNAINAQHALHFLQRAGGAMNDIRVLKDRCMGRTLTFSEGYERMGVLIEELRAVEVDIGMYVGGAGGPEAQEGPVRFSGVCLNSPPPLPPPPPPILQQPSRGPVSALIRNINEVVSARGVSRSNAVFRRRRALPRVLSEERRRGAYTTAILSPRPNRTGLLGARNPLLDGGDG